MSAFLYTPDRELNDKEPEPQPIYYRCSDCGGYFNEDGTPYIGKYAPDYYDEVYQCCDCKAQASLEYGRDD